MQGSQEIFLKINKEMFGSEKRKVEIQEMAGIKILGSENSCLS